MAVSAIGPVSRVAAAEDGVVVVAAVVAVARETAPWVHPPTTAPSKAVAATERLARESPAGTESASTRSRRSAVKDKVIAAASRWPTDTIISTITVKGVTPIMLMKVMSTRGKSNIHTDRVTLKANVIREASAMRKQAAPSSPNAPRSSHASLVSHANLGKPVSRRKPANRASLVSRANLGKPASLANHVSHAQSNTSRPHVNRNSTIHNNVRARDRQSSRRTSLARRPLSQSTRARQSPSSYGPRPRPATDATSNVS